MNEQPARILFFGNIAKQKGVDSLIKAFADVHQKMPESQLIIAGGYGDNTTYKAAVDALLLASPARSSITMVGRINDVDLISELRMCTLVTLPYIDQGIVHASGPLMLAMAAGKPVIASDTPVFHDEIRESQAGVLIAPGDTRALADKILNLLKDKPERSRLADNAKLHIANEHSDVVIREKLDRIYTCL
jgi:glycosyltransferase involved in cell wall biosynthesis